MTIHISKFFRDLFTRKKPKLPELKPDFKRVEERITQHYADVKRLSEEITAQRILLNKIAEKLQVNTTVAVPQPWDSATIPVRCIFNRNAATATSIRMPKNTTIAQLFAKILPNENIENYWITRRGTLLLGDDTINACDTIWITRKAGAPASTDPQENTVTFELSKDGSDYKRHCIKKGSTILNLFETYFPNEYIGDYTTCVNGVRGYFDPYIVSENDRININNINCIKPTCPF